jgi:hypothetical protein
VSMISEPHALPAFLRYADYDIPPQMTAPEWAVMLQLLESAKPEAALEIGTYQGGSLQALVAFARTVYSIDIDPRIPAALGPRFQNVRFRTGDSAVLLPRVLEEIAGAGERLGFVLVDGSHKTTAVRSDLDHLLQHVPTGPLYILMHDSFNPACRQGILSAAWPQCPHVHYLELDYVAGEFFRTPIGDAKPRTMWGGLALAVLLPQPRGGELTIQQSRRGAFEALYAQSAHHPGPLTLRRIARRLARGLAGRKASPRS